MEKEEEEEENPGEMNARGEGGKWERKRRRKTEEGNSPKNVRSRTGGENTDGTNEHRETEEGLTALTRTTIARWPPRRTERMEDVAASPANSGHRLTLNGSPLAEAPFAEAPFAAVEGEKKG